MQVAASKYGISEAARLLGVSADWLREGEKRGRLPKAERDHNGYRIYTPERIELLRQMRVGSHPRRLKTVEEVLGAAR